MSPSKLNAVFLSFSNFYLLRRKLVPQATISVLSFYFHRHPAISAPVPFFPIATILLPPALPPPWPCSISALLALTPPAISSPTHQPPLLYSSQDPLLPSLPPTPPSPFQLLPLPPCSPQFPRPLLPTSPTSPTPQCRHASLPSGCNGKSTEKTRGKSVLALHTAETGKD